MVFCPVCNGLMGHVRRFNLGGSYELFACGVCHYETDPKKISPNMYIQSNTKSTKKGKELKKSGVRRLHNNNKRIT